MSVITFVKFLLVCLTLSLTIIDSKDITRNVIPDKKCRNGKCPGSYYPGPNHDPYYPGPDHGPFYPSPENGPHHPDQEYGPSYPKPEEGPYYPEPDYPHYPHYPEPEYWPPYTTPKPWTWVTFPHTYRPTTETPTRMTRPTPTTQMPNMTCPLCCDCNCDCTNRIPPQCPTCPPQMNDCFASIRAASQLSTGQLLGLLLTTLLSNLVVPILQTVLTGNNTLEGAVIPLANILCYIVGLLLLTLRSLGLLGALGLGGLLQNILGGLGGGGGGLLG